MIALQRFDRSFRYASVAFYVLIAVQNLRLWAYPQSGESSEILTFSTLMAFEFVMVHSGLFMSLFAGSKKATIALIGLYSLFALAFNFAMPNNVILFTYLFAVANRFRYIFYEKASKEARVDMIIYSGIVTMIYFVLTVTIAASEGFVPPLGITEGYLKGEGYFDSLKASGLFVEKPYIGLALGTFYFSALALLEVRLIRNNGKLRKSTGAKSPLEAVHN